jgi:two-component system sensor histidine kinase DesK
MAVDGTPTKGHELDDAIAGLVWRDGRPRLVLRIAPLVLVLPPLVAFIIANPPAERLASLLPAIAAFVAIVFWTVAARTGTLSGRALVATILLTVLAVIVVVLVDPESPWLVLFLYPVVAAGWLSPVRRASVAIVTVSLVCAVAGWSVLGLAANRIERPLEFALIGFGSLAVARLVVVNRQLALARVEIVRLAAADERLRIARDLHDLLGHGLSLISIKAQLAGRLLPDDPVRAAAEVTDIEGVSRRALDDVRAAVGGYRRVRLDGELIGARAALDAAGVTMDVDHAAGRLPDDVDEAFAWSVREGATNVVRHARARNVVIRTRRGVGSAVLEVLDDGTRPTDGAAVDSVVVTARPGSGLAGLAERAGAIGGRVEAGARSEGGFRLAVVIPLDADLG